MIELKTYAGSNVTPQNDAILNDTNTLNNGIYYGCNVTIKDATTLHINAGQGIVYGRLFEVLDSDIPVSLSPSGTLLGQLYVHIDLSNIAAPIQILVDTGETLADLEDDPQLNIDSGITDMQLATFTVSTVGMSDLVETFKAVEPIRAVLGDADISAIGDGTVKGSIRALNTHLTASNNTPFRFGYDTVTGKYGYILTQGGADTVIPFKSGDDIAFMYFSQNSGWLTLGNPTFNILPSPPVIGTSSPVTYTITNVEIGQLLVLCADRATLNGHPTINGATKAVNFNTYTGGAEMSILRATNSTITLTFSNYPISLFVMSGLSDDFVN